jgi:hypothetical protein
MIQKALDETVIGVNQQPIFQEPTITLQMGTVTVGDDDRETLTWGKLEETIALLRAMPPLMTDIWFVDRSTDFHKFMMHFPEVAWSTGGVLLPGTGVRVHNWLSVMAVSGEDVPEWCYHPGIWVQYNNGQCYRFEDAVRIGDRGWYARMQWEFDFWHGRAVRFVDSLYERCAQLQNGPARLTVYQAISRMKGLLRLPVEFGPRDISDPPYGPKAFAMALKASVEALARTIKSCENAEGEPPAKSEDL